MIEQAMRTYARAAASSSGAIGLAVLIGWSGDVPGLTRVLLDAATMKPNTALCFLLLSVSVWCSILPTVRDANGNVYWSDRHRRIVMTCAAIAVALTLGTLLQYALGVDLRIDRLIFDVPAVAGQPNPARMAPISAVGMLLVAIAALTQAWGSIESIRLSEWCALGAAFTAFVAILGYVYGVNALYAVQIYTSIAIHTAIALLLLSTALLCANPQFSVMRRLQADNAGGVLARRLMPAAVLLPPTIGWLRLQGQLLGWYSTEFGLAVFATANVVTFSVLLWFTVRDLGQSDDKLRSQVTRLALLSQITRAIAVRQDMPSIYGTAIRSVADNLPVDFCAIAVCEPGAQEATVQALVNRVPQEPAPFADGESIRFDAAAGGGRSLHSDVVYEANTAKVQQELSQRFARAGLMSIVIAPLQSESSRFGVMMSARRRPDAFDSSDCEFLRQLAEQVGLAARQAELNGALQRAYDDLRQMQGTLMQQERLRALAEMSSGVAHDINNAITPVGLYVELLLENEVGLTENGRKQLGIVQRGIRNVASTVVRMNEFSRPLPAANVASVDLNEIARQVVELTRPVWKDQAQQRGAPVTLQLDLATEPMNVAGSAQEISDAFTNLIINAVDAMPAGGALALKIQRAGERICVEVADSGQGMSEEIRMHCMDPFFTTKGTQGNGLGLSMVYGMAQRHHAKLEIDSEPGHGTTMRLIFFPAAITAAADPAVASPADWRSLRILCVDDDPIVRHAVHTVLTAEGHRVDCADGGEAGVAAFRVALQTEAKFDVVITDLGMPDIDGRQVAARVKALSSSTPVIMLTGWGQRMLADSQLPANVDCLLAKPPRMHELRAALVKVVDRRH